MALNNAKQHKLHLDLLQGYKDRLATLEKEGEEEKEEPFERSFLHNAIYLHRLWFEQIEETDVETKTPLLEEILQRRESDLGTFQRWMGDFALAAKPNGWAVWGWSYPMKTFVGFPLRSHDDKVPLGVAPLLVIDCWEHAWMGDFNLDFDAYLEKMWKSTNWKVIEDRHQELAHLMGYGIK